MSHPRHMNKKQKDIYQKCLCICIAFFQNPVIVEYMEKAGKAEKLNSRCSKKT